MADYYVDYSASNDGNGTTAAQAGSPGGTGAYNTLASKTFASGDRVWLRRVTTANQSASLTLSTDGVLYIGWPKTSTDEYYSARPASGTSNGWDSDSNDYLVIQTATTGFQFTLSGSKCRYYRVQFKQTASGTVTFVTASGNSCFFARCAVAFTASINSTISYVLVSGNGNTLASFAYSATGVNTSSSTTVQISVTGNLNRFSNLSLSTNQSSGAGSGIVLQTASNTINYFAGVTMVAAFAGSTSASGSVPLFNFVGTVYVDGLAVTSTLSTYITASILTTSGAGSRVRGVSVDYCGNSTVPVNLFNVGASGVLLSISSLNEVRNTVGHTLFNFSNSICNTRIYCRSMTQNGNGPPFNFGNGLIYNLAVFFDNCTFGQDLNLNRPSSDDCVVYSSNHGQVTGLWKGYNRRGISESSNTVRSGGASFSVRMERLANVSGGEEPIEFGVRDGESIWISLTAGSRTVTLYGAHKGWGSTPPSRAELWFETEEKENDVVNNFVTSFDDDNPALTSDSSTWSNDPSVTAFKITKTFTVAADCVVPLRVYLSKFLAGAYVYIDPQVMVS